MRKRIFIICLTFFLAKLVFSQDSLSVEVVNQRVAELENQNKNLVNRIKKNESRYNVQKKEYAQLKKTLEDVLDTIKMNSEKTEVTARELEKKITKTDDVFAQKTTAVTNDIKSKTIWGIVSIFLAFFSVVVISLFFRKKIDHSNNSIVVIKESQRALMQESLKLDSKLIEILESQLRILDSEQRVADTEQDHSLALKIADEIIRIETNLLRMDSSIKGYKQLTASVRRIKDNFMANSYELVDMLGKAYNDGMKVVANFVPDENLRDGEQVITGIIKPQINYKGIMIQSAQITVSQNI